MTAIPYDDDDYPGLSSLNTGKGRLQRLVWQLLLEHAYADDEDSLPTSNRLLLYELEQRKEVTKSHRPGKRRGTADEPGEMEVSDASMKLRELGLITWEWIVDETRQLSDWRYADTVADYIRGSLDYARINPWDGEPPLLVESRSLGGVLRETTQDYLVSIAPTNGQIGGFLRIEVAPVLADNDRIVLYLGDEDLSGHQIENNTRRVLERVTGRAISWTRIAITETQIETLERHGMEPIWKVDRRYNDKTARPAWETEALGQSVIVRLVRGVLDALLPEPLAHVQVREEQEREQVAALLDGRTL
jgi:hypothetical protein